MKVLHLVGSPVSDFFAELSRLYARDCLEATADPSRYEPVIAYVEPGGAWRFPEDLGDAAIAAAPALGAAEAIARLGADVAVPQMFCLPGMTTYRALLDLLAIPYVGNTPDLMALTAHKARARAVVADAGVRVPAGGVVRAGEPAPVDVPLVVKPADADNSHGLSLVRDASEFDAAVAVALEHSTEALVEAFVPPGREVRCGVVVRDGELVCLPLEEYRLDEQPIRVAADKLARPEGVLALMAKDAASAWIVDPDDPVVPAVWEAARACHVALGCRHYSLFDFRIDPEGRPWFLEAGLYCSWARASVIPTMARAAGIELDDLFATALEGAL